MKIAILDDYQDSVRHLSCCSLLDGHAIKVFTNSARGLGQLSIRLASFDVLVLIAERTYLSRALLHKLPNLKLVVQTGSEVPQIDLAAASERGVTVVAGTQDPVAAAELTWGLIIAASRKMVQYAANLREGAWQASSILPEQNTLGSSLHGKTLGIWGYGRVGQRVARFGQAFGMQVLVWGSPASLSLAAQHGLRTAASKAALFSGADVVSVHLRLADTTRAGITGTDLQMMKTTALFVNTSHAELIAPGALQHALAQGRPGMAAVDVFDAEPLAPADPLLQMDNVLATPHIGFVTLENYAASFTSAFQAIADFAGRTGQGQH